MENKYYIDAQGNYIGSYSGGGKPSGVENIDYFEVTYPPPVSALQTWNFSTQDWNPYVAPYNPQPKSIINVVDEQGLIINEENIVELVVVVKNDGTHSVRARNVSDNGDGTWTIGPFL